MRHLRHTTRCIFNQQPWPTSRCIDTPWPLPDPFLLSRDPVVIVEQVRGYHFIGGMDVLIASPTSSITNFSSLIICIADANEYTLQRERLSYDDCGRPLGGPEQNVCRSVKLKTRTGHTGGTRRRSGDLPRIVMAIDNSARPSNAERERIRPDRSDSVPGAMARGFSRDHVQADYARRKTRTGRGGRLHERTRAVRELWRQSCLAVRLRSTAGENASISSVRNHFR